MVDDFDFIITQLHCKLLYIPRTLPKPNKGCNIWDLSLWVQFLAVPIQCRESSKYGHKMRHCINRKFLAIQHSRDSIGNWLRSYHIQSSYGKSACQ